MANVSIEQRLRLMGIDDTTRHNMRLIRPALIEGLDHCIDQLYRHLLSFPEAAKLLQSVSVERLKAKQRMHWRSMFDCAFDAAYVARAVQVGRTHFDHRVPPYAYLAAYSYMQSQLAACVARAGLETRQLASALGALSRVIMLDIDLALAAYTRAFWGGQAANEVLL